MNRPDRPSIRPARRAELDVIRTLVVVGLIFFHAALVFDSRDDFYVKNPETTDVTMVAAGFAVIWAMPALFLISGLGAWHSLDRRGPGGFAAERLRRLGVPLVFATVTIIPFPQWLRLKSDPDYRESYGEFLPRFFDVRLDLSEFPFVLQGEYFEAGHLWFVFLLLAFSLLLAPLAHWLPRDRCRQVADRMAVALRRRGAVLLPAVPVAVVCAVFGLEEDFAAWSRWAYLLFFLFGFILASEERFRTAMRRDASLAAGLGAGLFLATAPGFILTGDAPGGDPFTGMGPLAVGTRMLYGGAGWCVVVAILGLLDRRRRPEPGEAVPGDAVPGGRRRRIYGYLAAGVLPIYVLHQPIVVGISYGVVRWDAPMVVKYVAIVIATLGATLAAYDLLVRRTRVTRFLFGVRGRQAAAL